MEVRMRGVVLTVDQRSSRTSRDLVPDTLDRLGAGALLPFERTAGDEIQGVFTDPAAAVAAVETLLRSDAWAIGIGIGDIEDPLPTHARAGRGPAYVHARQAVNRAKQAAARVAVVGDPPYRATQLETALWLWSGLLSRRTDRGWEVADLAAEGRTHDEIARRLGITQPAVTQRAQAAGIVDAGRARQLAAELLAEALEES
jgi:DNA-binding CsgD family transcriptional regulator